MVYVYNFLRPKPAMEWQFKSGRSFIIKVVSACYSHTLLCCIMYMDNGYVQ
jgi:hypothetical protein